MTDTALFTNLDYALNYVWEFGWAVFPCHSITADGVCTCGSGSCKSPGKHPKTPKGVLDASKEDAQITAWFAGYQNSNIGIATGRQSNLIVLDLDTDKGAKSSDLMIGSLDKKIFTTPTVKTGAGLHHYYRYPAGVDIRNSASKLGQFIDVRGEGGYVIAPPSRHISGRIYEFETDNADLLDFPDEWINKLGAPVVHSQNGSNGASTAAVDGSSPFIVPPHDPGLKVPEEIDFGARNNTLIQLAGLLRHHGFSEGAIYAALAVENQRVVRPPIDDSELHDISRSAGRYAPKHTIDPVSDLPDGVADYENTLTAYSLGEFLDTKFEELEVLAFHISKTEIGIIQAPTNAGKTTILRNLTLAIGCGRPFLPFFDGHRPIKIAYFDFESSAQRAQPDLAKMVEALTPDEQKLARANIALIPKGMRNGELFQFNTGEDWVQQLLTQNGIEFVIVDNISAAYDLNDENSNAEINRKVIKPLLKMAFKGDCAFLFAHHYGKGKASELEQAGVHAGRGASNLQSLSQTVINMFGNVSKGEPITIECAKRKTDGGQNYREVFKLEDDRWFHHTTIVPPPRQRSCSDTLNEYINDNVPYPDTVTPADLLDVFDGVFGIDMINKTLASLAVSGLIAKQGRGVYHARKKKKAPAASPAPKTKDFYDTEKDED